MCDYLYNASEVFENDDTDKNNYNFIEYISEQGLFKQSTIDNLHRARIGFNLIIHEGFG